MAHSDPELDFSEPRSPPPPAETRDIYTPSRLNREARTLLERGLPALWLEGEISNLSRPSSGHWYFSLKDEAALLRDGDRESRFGDGVHGSGQDRQIQSDRASELRAQVSVARQEVGVCRDQEHVVEGECFLENAHGGNPRYR